jgi:hypothetical protein
VDSGDREVSGLIAAELLALASEPNPTLEEKLAYLEARGEADAREWLKDLAGRRAAARQELERRAAAHVNTHATRAGMRSTRMRRR